MGGKALANFGVTRISAEEYATLKADLDSLAASYGVYWNHEEAVGTCRRESGLEGIILGYPVISSGELGHKGSIKNMAGDDAVLRERFSLENQDLSQMPRTFIWNTFEDQKVPAANSILPCTFPKRSISRKNC